MLMAQTSAKAARAKMPYFEQLFIARGDDRDAQAFERTLYLIRKLSTHRLRSDENFGTSAIFSMFARCLQRHL